MLYLLIMFLAKNETKKPVECRIDLNDGNDSTISTTPHVFQWEKTFPAPEFHRIRCD